MALSRVFNQDDFFAPFFSGMPFTRDLVPAADDRTVFARNIPLDVVEQPNMFQVKADIPGVSKENIKVSVDGDVLRLSVEQTSETKDEEEKEGYKYHRYERASTFAGRAIRMPDSADMADVKAKYENGVLMLDIPKHEAKKDRSRHIDIE